MAFLISVKGLLQVNFPVRSDMAFLLKLSANHLTSLDQIFSALVYSSSRSKRRVNSSGFPIMVIDLIYPLNQGSIQSHRENLKVALHRVAVRGKRVNVIDLEC